MSANRVFTVVARWPEDEKGKAVVQEALVALRPYQTAMSLEDEISVLEFIEQHPEFDESIADEAREQAKALHDKLSLTN
ncbi:hypothetical protein P245_19695 [Comamonas thiooxydans]|uniref:Uncharacterized protein n=1 Tax=Comamonas thiooxydans TaxID=363952 RepID=A0A0E3BAF1_9BURK|nr:hypothetical protein [Comamonas thiooxydans]KGG87677.1 hypothetical protein P245_19695 [Comamonas thiooxydans]